MLADGSRPRVKEVIVVEGRDDTAACLRAADCLTIETHGFGIRKETWERIARAYEDPGIVIFTDPDHAGREIKRAILERFPDAARADLTFDQAEKDGDIGIENASPDDILKALARVCTIEYPEDEEGKGDQNSAGREAAATARDLDELGLTGRPDSAERRAKAGAALGIGYCNGKTLAKRVAAFGISRKELEEALGAAQGK